MMSAIPLADPNGASVLNSVTSLSGGADGDIYASDVSQRRVARFSSDAALVNSWEWNEPTASPAPDEIAWIGATEKYVVLLAGQKSVPTLHVWALTGEENLRVHCQWIPRRAPTFSAMAVSPTGQIFILDCANSRVYCYKINL